MSAVPPISRSVLDALHPGTAGAGLARETSEPVARAFVRLETALDAHTASLAALDGIEAALWSSRTSTPACPCRTQAARPPTRPIPPPSCAASAPSQPPAASPPSCAAARPSSHGPRRPPASARPARTRREARELSDAAGHMLLAPVETQGDLALKLAVLIAAGKATADDAAASPWVHLRALHADLHVTQPTR